MIPLDAGILETICKAPEDLWLRKLAADWWEEQGELDRAEFVRVQLELGELVVRDAKSLESLKERERELFLANGGHQLEWMGATHRLTQASTDWMNHLPWFRNGFVENVTCSPTDFLSHQGNLLQAAPIREVTFTSPFYEHTLDRLDKLQGRIWHLYHRKSDESRMFRTKDLKATLKLLWPKIQFNEVRTDVYVANTWGLQWQQPLVLSD